MSPSEIKEQILEQENELLLAFGNKDLEILEELIHNNALFILPNGLTVTKAMVLDNYKVGKMDMSSIIPSGQIINVVDDTAIVSVNLEMHGSYEEKKISSQFRYLRVWKLCDGSWKVIGVCGVPL